MWTMWLQNKRHKYDHSKQISIKTNSEKLRELEKDIDSLEIHLTTCEMYSCKECDFYTRQISEMKTHEKENKCDQKCTWHVKLNRNNQEEASMNLYKNSNLF